MNKDINILSVLKEGFIIAQVSGNENNFEGQYSPPQQVDTGNEILITLGPGQIIGRAQTMNATRSYGTQGVYEIGSIMPSEHCFLKFTGALDMNRIRLSRKSLARTGIVGLGEDILGVPVFHIQTINRYTGKVGIVYGKCSADSYNENYRANDFVREQARFFFCYSYGQGDYKPKYSAPRTVVRGVNE